MILHAMSGCGQEVTIEMSTDFCCVKVIDIAQLLLLEIYVKIIMKYVEWNKCLKLNYHMCFNVAYGTKHVLHELILYMNLSTK